MKKTYGKIAMIFFCFTITSSYGQWSFFASLGVSLNDVMFISKDTGMCSYNWYVPISNPQHPQGGGAFSEVKKTNNGTQIWSSVYYANDYNGGGVMSYNISAVRSKHTFYHVSSWHQYLTVSTTTNGGSTWKSNNLSTLAFYDFSVPDTAHWFLLRGNGTTKHYICKYHNGIMTNNLDSFSLQRPKFMFFPDSLTGYIAASTSQNTNTHLILKSTSGGTNWTTVFSDTLLSLRRMFFPSTNIGYVACASGKVIKTTDGGANWQYLTTGFNNNLNSIYFINDSTGFIAGDAGLIIRTSNGGMTWSMDNTGVTSSFSKIFFVNDSIGFALTGSTLYKINLASLIGINELQFAEKKHNLEIFPNPTQGNCYLKTPIEFLNDENLILNIYNSFGSIVQQINIKTNQEIIINLEKEPKGIYHITIGNNKKIYTGRIINL